MLTTDARKEHRSAGFRVVSVACAMMTVLGTAGVTRPVAAADRIQPPPYDRRVLSGIARDVLRNGATGANQSVAEPSLPGRTPGLKPGPENTVADTEPDEAMTATDIAPPLKGIIVPIDPLAGHGQQPTPGAVEAVGYHSNSWRQRTDTGRGLRFSSGGLAPASGLDPALAADTHGLRAEGRQSVYGFLLLRVPVDETLQNKLAGVGVELLGPHDDHHKARLPVASLQAIAAMPEVEWVGVSAQWQKLSSELSALRGGKGQTAVVGPGDSIPIVINLFDGDDNGNFRRQLEAAGATLGRYDADLRSYRAVATGPVIDTIIGFDFVLFVELIGLAHPTLDESTPLIDGDLIRPGTTTYGIPRFGGYSIPVGIMDSGFRMGVNGHDDLYFKEGCARNFTNDGLSAFNDQLGHGTHVLGIIAGTGSANSRYRGMAPSVGLLGGGGIRAAKIFKKDDSAPDGATGNINWTMAAMDWMAQAQDECGFPMPWVVNYSGGGDGNYLTGTDDESRRLDLHVFTRRQLYVVAAGNRGKDGAGTIGRPGVAKNALTVGSVHDVGLQSLGLTPGDISFSSSRGPTGDGRMKPNVVAPGHSVTSASASDLDGYRTEVPGTSFAAPLVTGLAATLMEHYPFELDPAMLRAHLMATAFAHDNVTGKSNDYGLGRVSGWVAHWDHTNNDGWSNFWFSGLISTVGGYHYRDLIVPPGTKRLSIVMTWDELPASAGASRAVMWDLDLWADQIDGCSGPCAQYRSVSKVDNVEYIVVNDPPAGTYRLRAFPISAPLAGIPFGVAATVIRGDTKAEMTAYIEAPSNAPVGAPFPVTMHVGNHSYVASAVSVDLITQPPGVTPIDIVTTRLDGVNMRFTAALGTMTLGNLPPEVSRYATWYFRPTTPGPKTFLFRASSENGGEILLTKTVQVDSVVNLVQTAMGTSPSAPLLAAGAVFSVTDTVQNTGTGPSESSTTRYYLSPDATKSADDTLLSGTHSVPSLDAGASHTATVKVTIPLATSPSSYFLIACADDKSAVVESNEGDNCMRHAGRHRDGGAAGSRGDRRDDEPHRAGPGARDGVLRDRHGAQPRAGGVSAFDDPLLPLARSGQGRGRRAAGREPRRAWPGGGRRPVGGPQRDDPGDHAAQQLLPAGLRRRPRQGGGERRDQQLRRLAHRGRDGDEARPGGEDALGPAGDQSARHQLPGDRHRAKCRRGGLRAVDDALLPVPRRGEECRRPAPDREPGGPRAGSRGQPFRACHGDHPRGHAAEYLLPARLCRWPEYGGGDQRDQQLHALQHHGHGYALIGRVTAALSPVVGGRGPRPLPLQPVPHLHGLQHRRGMGHLTPRLLVLPHSVEGARPSAVHLRARAPRAGLAPRSGRPCRIPP